jgi:hypothetical protein
LESSHGFASLGSSTSYWSDESGSYLAIYNGEERGRGVEEAMFQRARYKLDIDDKVIQAGRFDNKSTQEEQEEILVTTADDCI